MIAHKVIVIPYTAVQQFFFLYRPLNLSQLVWTVDPRSSRFLVLFCFLLHVRILLFLCLSQSLFSCAVFLLLALFLNIFNAVNLSLLFSPVFNHQSHIIFMNFLPPP